MPQDLKTLLQACIHCGICLNACPTYQVTGNEGNSPRGRLYLINDLVNKHKLNLESESIDYLDNCLACAACETVCPSGVNYTSILDEARHDYGASRYNHGILAGLRKIFFQYFLPRRYLLYYLRRITDFITNIIDLRSILPNIPKSSRPYKEIQINHYYRSKLEFSELADEKRTVTLVLGCVMDAFYNHVHWDTIFTLNAFGYHVYISSSACCGALSHHSGEVSIAEKQTINFINSVVEKPYPIVLNSAGCGAHLKEKTDLKIWDLIEALQQAPYNPMKQSFFENKPSKSFKTVPVLYHPACHLNHKQGLSKFYVDLLKQIPNLELMEIIDSDLCCGSAGFYNLIKIQLAKQIGELKAKQIKTLAAEKQITIVATANPGCISQLQGHLGTEFEVLHPITIVAAYLGL